jgi:ABC-type amino acid transport substrate-binding protein
MMAGLLVLLLQVPAPSILGVGLDPREAPAAFVPGANYSYDEMRKPPLMGEEALTRVAGFDVDVMNAIARRLGMKLVYPPAMAGTMATTSPAFSPVAFS